MKDLSNMAKKAISLFIIALALLGAAGLGVWGPAAQARAPRNVELMYFTAEGILAGVQLDWRTATEYETAAFRIKRASSAAGPFTFIDVWQYGQQISIIPLQNPGFPETGGIYRVQDLAAAAGQTFWYTLVEIEMDGDEIELETLSVVAGITTTPTSTPTATATGQVIGGGNNDNNTPTATPTATATQLTASPTPIPQNTSAPATATTRANTAPPTIQPTNTTTTTAGGSNGGSTGSGSSGGTTTTGGTSGSGSQPVAQITPTAAAYPVSGSVSNNAAPGTPEPTAAAYPEGQPTLTTDPNATPYPIQEVPAGIGEEEPYQGSTPAVTDFGTDAGSPADNTLPPPIQSVGDAAGSSTRGRIVLWIGFLGGLLIFAAGVFGTILLFTRKQNGPQ